MISSIKFNIYKDEFNTYIKINILWIINIKLNQKLFSKFITKIKEKSFDDNIKEFKLLIENNDEIKKIISKTKISKSHIIYYESYYDINLYEMTICSQFYILLKSILHSYFNNIKKEEYLIRVSENKKICVDIKMKTNVFDLVYHAVKIIIHREALNYERSRKFLKN